MRTPEEVAKVCVQNLDGCEFESEEIEVLRCIIAYRDSEIRAQSVRDTIEKAKAMLIEECGGHGESSPTCCDSCARSWAKVRECADALDALLQEEKTK